MSRQILYLILWILISNLACDFLKPDNNEIETTFQAPIGNVISGYFRDPLSGAPVEGQPIEVRLDSQPPDVLVSLDNHPIQNLTTSNGRISFALANDIEPSETNPIYVHLVATSDGYIEWQQNLKIIDTKPTHFYGDLIPNNSPQNGIYSKNISIELDAQGRVQSQPVELAINSASNEFLLETLLPAGTQILDRENIPLQDRTDITLRVYDGRNSTALTQYQNPFAMPIDLTDKSKRFSGLIPFLWMDYQIKDKSGRKAVRFAMDNGDNSKKNYELLSLDKILQTTIILKTSFPNFEAKGILQEGDQAQAWTIDRETNEWKNGRIIAIGSASNTSDLLINASFPNPGRWSFGWIIDPCPGGFYLNFSNIPEAYPTRTVITGIQGGFRQEILSRSDQIKIDIPVNMDLDVKVFNIHDQWVAGETISQACESGQHTMSISSPPTQQFTTARFIEINGFCPCKAGVKLQTENLPVWYQLLEPQPQSSWIFAGTTKRGIAEVRGLFINSTYAFATWFDGIWYTARISIADDLPLTTLETYSVNIQTASARFDSLSFVINLSEQACEKYCGN